MRQAELRCRASGVLPAAGFGNYDAGIIIREGQGSRVRDEDGKEYIDYLIGSGPMILGHAHPEVVEAVQEQLAKGFTFFANNARGIELAEEICRAVACAEQVRFVSSGGEADMYAMRLARAFTGRDKILKFEGGYHGMSAEALMSLAPQSLVNFPLAVPDSAGIPGTVRDNMLIAPFNDEEFIRSLVSEYAREIAAIIVEPLQRIIPPVPGFLEALRELCDQHGIVLVFDEIVTGFRLSYGGAQALYGVTPDVCTLGKIIGGGFPLAAITGRAEIMAHFDKEIVGQKGFLMQVGTLSGNPVAAVAGLKTMEILRREGAYDQIRSHGETVMGAMRDCFSQFGLPHQIVGEAALFDVVFTDMQVYNYRDMLTGNSRRYSAFHSLMRAQGIFKSPGKTYMSLALTGDDLEQTSQALSDVASRL